MKRSEIATKYKWDLTTMFENQSAFDEMVTQATSLIETLGSEVTTFHHNFEACHNFFLNYELLQRNLAKLYVYSAMSNDVEAELTQNQDNLVISTNLSTQATTKLANFNNQIIKHADLIKDYLQSDELKEFSFFIQTILDTKPHCLSDEQEAEVAELRDILNNAQNTFAAWRLEFEPVIIDGEPQFLNLATLKSFLENSDQSVRKQAYEKFFGQYQKLANPLASLLLGNVNAQNYLAKKRNFSSARSASLFEDHIEDSLFELVLKTANETYINYFHDYNKFKKAYLSLDTLNYYDLNVPLLANSNKTYEIEECFTILKAALSPLGEEYVSLLERAQNENWIDFKTHLGKRVGAYSWGTYDSNPHILMNFTNSYDSLSTLAHELGHSMHSYYSRSNNRPINAEYKIFVAEVASTVNELLLNDYLIKQANDKVEKASLQYHLLEQLVGTLYRQPMFAKFEDEIHTIKANNQPLSANGCAKLYTDLSKAYYGDSVELDDLIGYGCFYIPHFYYNFYVYKYTVGMACAISFAKEILNGNTESYLEFLKSGGKDYPANILSKAGVNPNAESTYHTAFNYFNEILVDFKNNLG